VPRISRILCPRVEGPAFSLLDFYKAASYTCEAKKQEVSMMPDGSDVTKDASVNIKEAEKDFAKKGCLVSVRITKPTFQTKLSWSEIGLEDSVSIVASPPTTKAPAGYNEFTRLEQAMRSRCKWYSIGAENGFRFMPYHNFDKMLAEVLPIKDEYLEYAKKFCSEYEDKLEQLIEEWREQAGVIYDNLDSATVGMSRLEFIDRIEGKLRNKLPVAHGLIDRFSVNFPTLAFDLPKPGNVVLKEAPLLAEYTKQLAADTFQGFFMEVATDLRKRTAKVCGNIFEVMKKNGKITEKSLAPLRDYIKLFETLNVIDDAEVAEHLEKIKKVLTNKDDINDNNWVDFGTLMKDAADFVNADIENIAKEKMKAMYGGGVTGRNLML
jgi:hypothetical protein